MRTLALLAALALACHAAPARAEPPRFDSLFWQPDLAEGFGDPVQVAAEVDRAARAGVRTIVVQWLAHGRQNLLDVTVEGRDPIETLLDEAHARGISVWLGTWEDPAIWRTRQIALPVWRGAMIRGTALAAEAAARYGRHPALAGWYYTPEAVWWRPPSPPVLERLTALTAEAVARLRALTSHPVAIALGPSGRGEANLYPISWCRYLEGSRPDVVVVMDGVGSAHLDVALAPALYGIVHRCAERADATMWADVELFGPDRRPPSLERLGLQYDAARASAIHVTAFDQPHYLMPDTPGGRFWAGERAAGPALPVLPLRRTPDGPWTTQRPRVQRGHVDALLAGPPTRLARVEVVVRREARSVSVDGLRPEGGVLGGADLVEAHGPGRDEWTWSWDLPPTAPLLAGVRARVEAGRQPVEVVAIRLLPAR